MDNQQRNTAEDRLHWLGGIIDGEGSVTVCMSRQRRSPINYSPRICFVNTDVSIIEAGAAILKENDIPFHIASTCSGGFKVCYRVNIGGMKRSLRAAELLVNYVRGEKKRKMEVMIEWIKYRFSLPHKHPQTEIDMQLLTQIRQKPIDPLLAVPFRDRTPSPTSSVGEDTVQSASNVAA